MGPVSVRDKDIGFLCYPRPSPLVCAAWWWEVTDRRGW